MTEGQREKRCKEEREKAEKPYDMWMKEEDRYDGYVNHLKPKVHSFQFLPPPKKHLNLGHELSYNPPIEYLPTTVFNLNILKNILNLKKSKKKMKSWK